MTTTAAKLTDVPGHTKAIIDLLAQYGVSYLHIGVNPASAVPEIPDAFVWRSEKGNEIIVNYAYDYGKPYENPDIDDILYFAHTNDNKGPQSPEQLHGQLKALKERYPDCRVEASTLNRFAKEIWLVKDRLPVVTSEIGDTWIHGIGSDPVKVARYRELLGLKDKWLSRGSLVKESAEYRHFCGPLLMVAEHTWGMDEKSFLPDFAHYLKHDFREARARDTLDLSQNPPGALGQRVVWERLCHAGKGLQPL